MTYSVVFSSRARKAFLDLDKPVRQRVGALIDGLRDEPRPAGAVQLVGMQGTLRVRAGDYRVVYEVDDDQLRVLVLKVGHRREIYGR